MEALDSLRPREVWKGLKGVAQPPGQGEEARKRGELSCAWSLCALWTVPALGPTVQFRAHACSGRANPGQVGGRQRSQEMSDMPVSRRRIIHPRAQSPKSDRYQIRILSLQPETPLPAMRANRLFSPSHTIRSPRCPSPALRARRSLRRFQPVYGRLAGGFTPGNEAGKVLPLARGGLEDGSRGGSGRRFRGVDDYAGWRGSWWGR
jgi:hypothetical protein